MKIIIYQGKTYRKILIHTKENKNTPMEVCPKKGWGESILNAISPIYIKVSSVKECERASRFI